MSRELASVTVELLVRKHYAIDSYYAGQTCGRGPRTTDHALDISVNSQAAAAQQMHGFLDSVLPHPEVERLQEVVGALRKELDAARQKVRERIGRYTIFMEGDDAPWVPDEFEATEEKARRRFELWDRWSMEQPYVLVLVDRDSTERIVEREVKPEESSE
jgi:hypothetical protein